MPRTRLEWHDVINRLDQAVINAEMSCTRARMLAEACLRDGPRWEAAVDRLVVLESHLTKVTAMRERFLTETSWPETHDQGAG